MYQEFITSLAKLNNKNSVNQEHFILSNTNQQAFLYISKWPNWYGNNCFLVGDAGSGKSFLSKIWHNKSKAEYIDLFNLTQKQLDKILRKNKAFIIEDVEKYFIRKYLLQNLRNHDFESLEETLISIIDYCKNNNCYILFNSSQSITDLNIKLDDLKSRMLSTSIVKINTPNESLISTYIVKLFAEAQLKISNKIVDYICKNIKKSLTEANKIVAEIDNFSIETKRNITISLVKEVLHKT